MEINKAAVSETVTHFTKQTKELLGKVDTEKAMGVTNKFMAGVFKFGKLVSALFMFLCIFTMIGSLVYYVFAGPDSISVPDFDDYKESLQSKENMFEGGSKVSNKLFKELRDDFGSKVDDLIEVCGLDAKEHYNWIIEELAGLDADYRSAFIKGAISFSKDYKKHYNDKFNGNKCFRDYRNAFQSELAKVESSVAESRQKRPTALIVCGGALIALIQFLFIPLLIQIEENTRK